MKLIISCALLLVLACNNNKSVKEDGTVTQNKSKGSGDNRISFKVEGQGVETGGWNVMRFIWDEKTPNHWINITSNMHKDKRTINVNLNGAVPGTYKISEDGGLSLKESHGVYFPDFSKPLESYSFESGEFVLTEVDTVKNIINGRFSGVVKSIQGTRINITDGKIINLNMKPGLLDLSKSF